jgi:hypothetical protein
VKRKTIILSAALVMGMNAAQAFDFGNMMNPGRWFDNDHDRYDRYDRGYYGGGYGPYGYGPYGGGWGGPYGGWGGPYGGWGGPWGGGYPGTIVVSPSQGSSTPPPPKTPE